MFTILSFSQGVEIKDNWLIYNYPSAKDIVVAGDWNDWAGSAVGKLDLSKDKMIKKDDGKWYYDLSNLKPGYHEYKFIINGKWESGANRKLFIFKKPTFEKKTVHKKFIIYKNKYAKKVSIAGDWNNWAGSAIGDFKPDKYLMQKDKNGNWIFSVENLSPGQHSFKFIIDGNWEGGNNRVVYVNENHEIYNPSDYLSEALYWTPDTIKLVFPELVSKKILSNLKFEPDIKIKEINLISLKDLSSYTGYYYDDKYLYFKFDAFYYNIFVKRSDKVYVVGDFNNWVDGFNENWQLIDPDNNGIFYLKVPLSKFEKDKLYHFCFVINKTNWLNIPAYSPNKEKSDDGRYYLKLMIKDNASYGIFIKATENLDLSKVQKVFLKSENIARYISPSDYLFQHYFISNKKLGVTLENNKTIFRVYAPRASKVKLNIYDDPYTNVPIKEYFLEKDKDGVWEITIGKNYAFYYYKYQVDGPKGPGEMFDFSKLLSDPYAKANVGQNGKSIIIPDNYTDDTFTGWTDGDFKTPPQNKLVIYEAHIRDLTMDKSCNIPDNLRGKFLGLVETLKTENCGIPYLKDLGINALELLPIQEFDENPYGSYHWGYMTSLFFAPESSYATNPTGKQVTEFKKLVNALHNNGIAVILDIVFNHTGGPNYFAGFDNKYYYRLTKDFSYENWSGCGNDFKTENPMVRKYIVDCILYWIKEYHVDGFRFDLGELIDRETLKEIYIKAKEIKPDVILILEPWSFRGSMKGYFKTLDWAYWNDDFRNNVKGAVKGYPDKEILKKLIKGSIDLWASKPIVSVNYLSSHDDYTLIDELTSRADHNGLFPTLQDIKKDKMAAFVLFTSLGMTMISEGQEILYSRAGIENGYNAGDKYNSVKWDQKEKYPDTYNFYKNLIHFRLSKAGKPFRLPVRPSETYFEWIEPQNNKYALGYIINADRTYSNYTYMVLMNFHHYKYASFDLNGKSGKWKLIFDENGFLSDYKVINVNTKFKVKVPPLSGYIYQKIWR